MLQLTLLWLCVLFKSICAYTLSCHLIVGQQINRLVPHFGKYAKFAFCILRELYEKMDIINMPLWEVQTYRAWLA